MLLLIPLLETVSSYYIQQLPRKSNKQTSKQEKKKRRLLEQGLGCSIPLQKRYDHLWSKVSLFSGVFLPLSLIQTNFYSFHCTMQNFFLFYFFFSKSGLANSLASLISPRVLQLLDHLIRRKAFFFLPVCIKWIRTANGLYKMSHPVVTC